MQIYTEEGSKKVKWVDLTEAPSPVTWYKVKIKEDLRNPIDICLIFVPSN